jgi:hypothetical protein
MCKYPCRGSGEFLVLEGSRELAQCTQINAKIIRPPDQPSEGRFACGCFPAALPLWAASCATSRIPKKASIAHSESSQLAASPPSDSLTPEPFDPDQGIVRSTMLAVRRLIALQIPMARSSAFQRNMSKAATPLGLSRRAKRIFETFHAILPKKKRRIFRHALCNLRSAQNISRML